MSVFKKITKYKWIIKLVPTINKIDRHNIIQGYKHRHQYYHSPLPEMKADLKKMLKCALCPSMCRFDCPALLVSKREPYSPGNKARLGLFMGMGRIPLNNPSAIKAMYACMTCDACKQWCPMDISTGVLLKQMRAELEKENLLPASVHYLQKNIVDTSSIFDQSPYVAGSEFDINMPNPEVFYYVGCMTLRHRPNTARAMIALLKATGVSFCTRLGERKCCGSPLNKVGYRSVTQKLATENKALIEGTGVKQVVTDCPACAEMLRTTYKEDTDIKIKVEAAHAIPYFLKLLKAGKLKPSVSINKIISYHDPCIMGRINHTAHEARELFAALPGVTLKEAYLHAEETRCCGMGGGYHATNPEFSDQLGKDRLIQLRKYQPDYIVSACPTCEFTFTEAKNATAGGKENGEQIKDIIELLADALGLKY